MLNNQRYYEMSAENGKINIYCYRNYLKVDPYVFVEIYVTLSLQRFLKKIQIKSNVFGKFSKCLRGLNKRNTNGPICGPRLIVCPYMRWTIKFLIVVLWKEADVL
jgi:hypothetical protein